MFGRPAVSIKKINLACKSVKMFLKKDKVFSPKSIIL